MRAASGDLNETKLEMQQSYLCPWSATWRGLEHCRSKPWNTSDANCRTGIGTVRVVLLHRMQTNVGIITVFNYHTPAKHSMK